MLRKFPSIKKLTTILAILIFTDSISSDRGAIRDPVFNMGIFGEYDKKAESTGGLGLSFYKSSRGDFALAAAIDFGFQAPLIGFMTRGLAEIYAYYFGLYGGAAWYVRDGKKNDINFTGGIAVRIPIREYQIKLKYGWFQDETQVIVAFLLPWPE